MIYLLSVLGSGPSFIVLVAGVFFAPLILAGSLSFGAEKGWSPAWLIGALLVLFFLVALLPLIAAFPPLLVCVTSLGTGCLPQRRSTAIAVWVSMFAAALLLLLALYVFTTVFGFFDRATMTTQDLSAVGIVWGLGVAGLAALASIIGLDIVFLRMGVGARPPA